MDENEAYTVNLNRTLVKDGPNFLSHRLIIAGELAYLRPTFTAMFFCIIYILVGVFLIGIATNIMVVSNKYDLAIFVGGFGIAIATFGCLLIQPFLSRANFNKDLGIFNNHKDRNVKLDHIISLQINNKMIQRKHALSYACFELNLLTKHGRRINILNHNDQQNLIQDAESLGRFLSVEVKDCRREIVL